MNGYLYTIEEKDTGVYTINVAHAVHGDISATKTVEEQDLLPGYKLDSREQHEHLILPIIEELDDKRLEAEAQKRHDKVDADIKAEKDERDASKEYRAATSGKEAEDTSGSEHSGEPEGDGKKEIKVSGGEEA